MQDVFRGRKTELRILDKKYKNPGFVMTVLYGHRRIGKTKLINKFIHEHDCKSISFTAVERGETELLSMMTESVLNALSPELVGTISFNSFENLFEYIGAKAEKERLMNCRRTLVTLVVSKAAFLIAGRDHVPRAASSFAGSKTIKRVAHKTTR